MPTVQVDAGRGSRSLTRGQPDGAATLRRRRMVLGNPVLLFFRRGIDTAVAEAKKTRNGLPTDTAIEQRWWINDYRPDRTDRSPLGRLWYMGSFECCCEMLGLEVEEERKRVLAEIDDCLVRALVAHAGDVVYRRRAAVLTCAGLPTAVGKQFVLGLVDASDYEDVADEETVKSLGLAVKRESRERTRLAKRRKLTSKV